MASLITGDPRRRFCVCGDRSPQRFNNLNGSDGAITAARQRLNETRLFRRIVQSLPNLIDRRVQAMVDIDNGVWPKTRLKRLSPYNFTGAFQQNCEDLERLPAEPPPHRSFTQLTS